MCPVKKHSTIFKAFIALLTVLVIFEIALISWNSKILRSFQTTGNRLLDTLQRDMQNGTERYNSPQYLKTNMKFYMAFSYLEQLSKATENPYRSHGFSSVQWAQRCCAFCKQLNVHGQKRLER